MIHNFFRKFFTDDTIKIADNVEVTYKITRFTNNENGFLINYTIDCKDSSYLSSDHSGVLIGMAKPH